MKPKEKMMKWLILVFVVGNYTKSEYITDVDTGSLNGKLSEQSEHERMNSKSKELQYSRTWGDIRLAKISRYEQRDEHSSIIKLKASRRMLDRNSRSERNNNDKRRDYATREIREVYFEIPRLNIREVPSSRFINMERSSRIEKGYLRNVIRQRKVRMHDQNIEMTGTDNSIRQQPRKLSRNRFYSTRQNNVDNSKENYEATTYTPVNEIRIVKRSSMSEDRKRQVNRESRNNIEQNNRQRVENVRQQNDRRQTNRNRQDRTRATSRDNIIRFASEERSVIMNTFIPKFSSGFFIESEFTKVRANREITLNRQKRNTLRQMDKRIQSRDFFRVADFRRNSRVNKNAERISEDRHRDNVGRQRININSRRYRDTNREESDQSNKIGIREIRREKSENRNDNRIRSESSPIQARDTRNSYERRLARNERFHGNPNQINEVNKIRSSAPKSRNQVSNERKFDLVERSSSRLNSKSSQRRMENIQNENKRMDVLREINIRNSARNTRRNAEEKERNIAIRSNGINRNMEKIRSINARSINREITRNQLAFSRETRLNNIAIARTASIVSTPSENRQIENIRLQNARENGRRDVLARREAKYKIASEFSDYRHNRFDRKSTREVFSIRQNAEIRFRKPQTDRRDGNNVLTEISNIQLRKSYTNNIRERSLQKNIRIRKGDKVQNILLKENQLRHRSTSRSKDRTEFLNIESRNDNAARNQRTIKSDIRERTDISRQNIYFERQLKKNNGNWRRIDNSVNRRNDIRDIRKIERTVDSNREEKISRDRNIRKRSNRNVFRLQMKNARLVRNEHQRDSQNDCRNIQHRNVEANTIQVKEEYPQNYRISAYVFQRILSNDFYRELNKFVRMERNGRQLRERNSNRLSGERITVMTTRNIMILTTDEVFERKTQNIERATVNSRRNQRIRVGNDLSRDSKLMVNQFRRNNKVSDERHSALQLQNNDKLRRETRELRNDRRFFSKVRSGQDLNARNLIKNNRLKLAAHNRNSRGFRGKTTKAVEILTLSRQNTQLRVASKRILLNLRNSDNLQKKSLTIENQNNNILRQRNGRGYRGKPAERIAEQRALNHKAKELDFISFVNSRKMYQVINTFSRSSNFAQTSASPRRNRNVNRRISERKSDDNMRQNNGHIFIASVMSAERTSPTSKSRQLKSSETRLSTRDSNKPTFTVIKDLTNPSIMHSSRINLRLDRRLNIHSISRNDIRKNLNRQSRKENRYFDTQFRNVETFSDVRQKSSNSYEAIRKIGLPSNRQSRRQVSRSSLVLIRYSSPREEARKVRMRSILRDEMRKFSKREDCDMLSSISIPDTNEIQMYSALEVVPMPKSNILEKLSSSRIHGKQEGHPNTEASARPQEYWKISGKYASSFLINLILGLLIILANSEKNGIKAKPFKERLCDILLLRSSVF